MELLSSVTKKKAVSARHKSVCKIVFGTFYSLFRVVPYVILSFCPNRCAICRIVSFEKTVLLPILLLNYWLPMRCAAQNHCMLLLPMLYLEVFCPMSSS